MDVTDLNPDEKRLLLKNFNHRLNNDLQEVLALIKLKKRFNTERNISVQRFQASLHLQKWLDPEERAYDGRKEERL